VTLQTRPSSFILVDDLSLENARKMWSNGYQCCVLLQTSPKNYQAWVKVAPSPIWTLCSKQKKKGGQRII